MKNQNTFVSIQVVENGYIVRKENNGSGIGLGVCVHPNVAVYECLDDAMKKAQAFLTE